MGGVGIIVTDERVSVCPLAYLENNRTSPNFLSMLYMAVARSSSGGAALGYVLPVLWMTSCFHMMGPIR